MKEGLSLDLANGGTLKSGEGTGEATAKAVGVIYGVDLILEMTFEEEEGKNVTDSKNK